MDFIEIGPYSFCLCGDLLYTDRSADLTLNGLSFEDRVESVNQLDYPKFNRSTRIRLNPSEEKIKVLDPPSEPNEPERDIVKQLMPSVAMLGVVVLLRGSSQGSNTSFILMSVGTMGVGILTSIYTIFKDRSNYKKKLVDRSKAYETYITNKRSTIREYREEEARILEETFYSADKELAMVEGFDRSLFDRVPADKDFLEVRLGTGDRESVRKTETKDREKVEATDNLTEIPSKVEEEFKYLLN